MYFPGRDVISEDCVSAACGMSYLVEEPPSLISANGLAQTQQRIVSLDV